MTHVNRISIQRQSNKGILYAIDSKYDLTSTKGQ